MLLCLDIGNTSISGCVFKGGKITRRFRLLTRDHKKLIPLLGKKITACAVSSVAPAATKSVLQAITKTCGIKPFVLNAATPTPLKSRHKTLGADRIAAAVGAMHVSPRKNLVLIDMGTFTTFAAITQEKEFLGGVIMPGIMTTKRAAEAIVPHLPQGSITRPKTRLGRTTQENFNIGYYAGHLGALREIIAGLKTAAFKNKKTAVIATGGYAATFKSEKIFDAINPDLIFHGLRIIYAGVQKAAKGDDLERRKYI